MRKLDYKNGRLLLYTSYKDMSKCRQIVGGKWLKKEKAWSYPVSALSQILKVFNNQINCSTKIKHLLKVIDKKFEIIKKLKDNVIEPNDHAFLMRHQRVCRDIASLANSYAFFLDTGTGKTITALQIIKDNLGLKWVVVCPKSIIKPAWMEDKAKFFPELRMLPLSKNIRKEDYLILAKEWDVPVNKRCSVEDLRNMLAPWAQIYIINPESFKKETLFLLEQKVKGLIFDESAKIKDPKSQITKAILKFGQHLQKRYILSGKPAPNTPLEYFSQMNFVDDGVFGNSFYQFRNAFFNPVGYMGYDWQLKQDKQELFTKRLSMKSIFIDKTDCLDLPDKTYLKRSIQLGTNALKYYMQMEKTRLLRLNKTTVIAPNILTSIMKLRQITSGFVIDNKQATQMLHTQKLDELMNVLEEIGDKQVIIWCNFKNEIRSIYDALTKKGKTVVTAYSETKNTDDSVVAFKTGKAQYIIAHPQTLKYGVTFVNCTYAVYYSLSYSYDDYYQSHDRIYRKGQTKPCTFIFLLCERTIDELIYEVLQAKGDLSDAIKEYAKGIR